MQKHKLADIIKQIWLFNLSRQSVCGFEIAPWFLDHTDVVVEIFYACGKWEKFLLHATPNPTPLPRNVSYIMTSTTPSL